MSIIENISISKGMISKYVLVMVLFLIPYRIRKQINMMITIMDYWIIYITVSEMMHFSRLIGKYISVKAYAKHNKRIASVSKSCMDLRKIFLVKYL